MKITSLRILGFYLLTSSAIFAAPPQGTPEEEALRVRKLIELPPERAKFSVDETTTISLPVSACRTQGYSELCWNFSGMNLLETNYLAAHPEVAASDVSFSRRIVYYWANLERYMVEKMAVATRLVEPSDGSSAVKIKQGPNKRLMRGTTMDSLRYSKAYGLVAYNDFDKNPDAEDLKPIFNFGGVLGFSKAIEFLNKNVGVIPETTKFRGKEYSAKALGDEVIGDSHYVSFAFQDGLALDVWLDGHVDSDNHMGDQSYSLSKNKLRGLIRKALENKSGVEITVEGHSILIYGVTFNSQTQVPVSYLVKDSYGDCFYTADARELENRIWEVTTRGRVEDFN